MGTKLEELSPSGCFARAKPDEPMFVLLARDPGAPAAIEAWADERERQVGLGRRPAKDLHDVGHARATAAEMRAWRDAHDGMWREGMFNPQPVVIPHERRRPD